MMIFPGVSICSTCVHQELQRSSSQTVMSSLLLLIMMDIHVLRVVSSIPSMGIEAPCQKFIVFLQDVVVGRFAKDCVYSGWQELCMSDVSWWVLEQSSGQFSQ